MATTGEGEEYELIGVVNGLWHYDPVTNLKRLKQLLPEADEVDLESQARRHQVRVGFERSFWKGRFVDVATLPENWTYTLSPIADEATEVQPGDLVVVAVQKGRLVDRVLSVHRRCSEPQPEGEAEELGIGCFEIYEFDSRGYGGKKYFFTAF
jgi:hypothetical protein